MDNMKKYAKMILNIIIPAMFFYLVCFWGPRLLRFFLPFVIGWIIAMIANPLVRFLENRLKIVRKHGSFLIVIAVLALIIGLLYLLIYKLVVESAGLLKDLPRLYHEASAGGAAMMEKLGQLLQFLPVHIQASINQFTTHIGEYLSLLVQKMASPTVTAAGNVAKGIPNALVNSVITIFSSYLFIVERDRIIDFWKKHTPDGGTRYYRFLKKDVKHLVGVYFLAQFKIMFVIAVILLTGFFVLGVPYALLLAVLIAVLDFLPIFGTGTALLPWAVVKLFMGEYAFGIGLILLYVLTQVTRQVIQPKIVGDTMGIPPLLTLLFLYLGFKLSGIAGMILAVPVGMLFINLYKYGAFDTLIESVRTLAHDINEFRKSK